MRVLGRWMRMLTIPNQSSVAKAWMEFDDNGRMKDSAFCSIGQVLFGRAISRQRIGHQSHPPT